MFGVAVNILVEVIDEYIGVCVFCLCCLYRGLDSADFSFLRLRRVRSQTLGSVLDW